MSFVEITDNISLSADELGEKFVRASGPGGQNVNAVATAVQLRFNVSASPSLPERVRAKILESGDSRLTTEGELVIIAERHRTQEANRKDALERLKEIIRKAAHVPKRRIATRPTRASQRRRVDGKVRRGAIKRGRGRRIETD